MASDNMDIQEAQVVIKIAAIRNGYLVHTQWGRFTYSDLDVMLKELKPQFKKLLESANHFYEKKQAEASR